MKLNENDELKSHKLEKMFAYVVGNNLYLLREKQGLDIELIADILGVSHQELDNYETGKKHLTVARFLRLCDILNIVPDDIFRPTLKNTPTEFA